MDNLRRLSEDSWLIMTSPIKWTWLGGSRLASDRGALKNVVVTRQEYQENGSTWLLKRFAGGSVK